MKWLDQHGLDIASVLAIAAVVITAILYGAH